MSKVPVLISITEKQDAYFEVRSRELRTIPNDVRVHASSRRRTDLDPFRAYVWEK